MPENSLSQKDVLPKKALLVGSFLFPKKKQQCLENLAELESLCTTAGFEPVSVVPCPLKRIDSATYIGKGKIKELLSLAEKELLSLVIFDDELFPNQQRNLEKIFKRPVIDRTELILDVFAKRARTQEAKIQIKLAQYKYQLPRLKRMWTHLSRQKVGGGSGGYLKGEGERQIEIDRRIIKSRISDLKKKIDEVKTRRRTQRKKRQKNQLPVFALVGYTNVGKSTLLNALTDAEVLAEDKLFATLDTTTRKYAIDGGGEILLTDTVGFIRKLPHALIASFRSTLEEAAFADVLVHIVDVSHFDAFQQAESSLKVLQELNLHNKPMITVLNKADLVKDRRKIFQFKISYPFTVELSALKKTGFEQLQQLITKQISNLSKKLRLKIPQSNYRLVSILMRQGRILDKEYRGNDIFFEAEIPHFLQSIFSDFKLK